MSITLRKRSRAQPGSRLPPSHDDIARAERAAMTSLAGTLRQLAAELPAESRLAVEFTRVARSIDVAGVLGTWRLDAVVRELAEDAAERQDFSVVEQAATRAGDA